MEKSTPIGLIAGLGLVFGAIFLGDGAMTFFDPRSLLIVVGGTVAALLVAFTMTEMKAAIPATKGAFGFQAPDCGALYREFSELARLVRRDGLLALDRRLGEVEDPLMRFGLELAVDGVEADEVEALVKARVQGELRERQLPVRFFSQAGLYAPAFGMVGTLIGLIQMLQNLTDPEAIGPAMAVAMITTFYGALLANLIFLPLAAKIRIQNADVARARQMVATGVLALVRGEAPMMVEKRLQSFLGDAPVPTPDPTPLKKVA